MRVRWSCMINAQSLLFYKMKAFLILLATASFTLVAAQEPQRCTAPLSWHAHLFQVSPNSRSEVSGRIYYDLIDERVAVKEEISIGEQNDYYEDFAFFKQHIRYRYNVRTKQCFRYALNETFRPFAIPYGAKFVERVEIGSNAVVGAGVEVNIWEGDAEDGGRVVSVWTAEGCLPVSERYYSTRTGFIVSDFYDVELGYNPDDFVPPTVCQ